MKKHITQSDLVPIFFGKNIIVLLHKVNIPIIQFIYYLCLPAGSADVENAAPESIVNFQYIPAKNVVF